MGRVGVYFRYFRSRFKQVEGLYLALEIVNFSLYLVDFLLDLVNFRLVVPFILVEPTVVRLRCMGSTAET